MTTNRHLVRLVAGIAFSGLAGSGVAHAEELRFATGSPQDSLGSKALDSFAEAVEAHSEGDITVRG